MKNSRSIARVVTAGRTLEGGGFEVRRPFPGRALMDVDPFLLLDEMGPSDLGPGQAKGAPDHPHRGFETVTYLLSGGMRHKDSQGNAGRLRPGDVQWMTAGAGVVHSEMPDADILEKGGRMHGFQLWVNLPARDKMTKPRYQEIPSEKIPAARSADGKVAAKVIAGEALGVRAVIETRTPILYFHLTFKKGGEISLPVPTDFNVFAYVFGGAVEAGAKNQKVADGQAALFASDGAGVDLRAVDDAEVLLIGGRPLNEPVARYGPFVMNQESEIHQAFADYRAGRLGQIAS